MTQTHDAIASERARLLAKGRLLFDSCDDDFACLLGYLDDHRAQGGWHADVMQEFLTWVEGQTARNDDLGIRAAALLRAVQRDRSV